MDTEITELKKHIRIYNDPPNAEAFSEAMNMKDQQIKFLQWRIDALEKELKKQKDDLITCRNIIYNYINKLQKEL